MLGLLDGFEICCNTAGVPGAPSAIGRLCPMCDDIQTREMMCFLRGTSRIDGEMRFHVLFKDEEAQRHCSEGLLIH